MGSGTADFRRPTPLFLGKVELRELSARRGHEQVMDTDEAQSDALIIRDSLHDAAQFGALFDRHYDDVCSMVARRYGPELADEVATETFLIAFERRAKYRDMRGSARPWLFGIALNLCRQAARRRAVDARALARAIAGEPVAVAPAHAHIEREQEREGLRVAMPQILAALAERDRDALLLHCWEGLSYDEVSIALGIPIGTVRSRINRARKIVSRGLDEHMTITGSAGHVK
ncbi:MAG: rpoE [Thermoleophilia bacterium]|nr:rpoE [Thermoleophilia bacterium]